MTNFECRMLGMNALRRWFTGKPRFNRQPLLPDLPCCPHAMKLVYMQIATPDCIIVEVGPDFSIHRLNRNGSLVQVAIGNVLNRAIGKGEPPDQQGGETDIKRPGLEMAGSRRAANDAFGRPNTIRDNGT